EHREEQAKAAAERAQPAAAPALADEIEQAAQAVKKQADFGLAGAAPAKTAPASPALPPPAAAQASMPAESTGMPSASKMPAMPSPPAGFLKAGRNMSENAPAARPEQTAEGKKDAASATFAVREYRYQPPGESIRQESAPPDTLFWRPLLLTDAQGRAAVEFDLPQSEAAYRVSIDAHTQDGRLGSAQREIAPGAMDRPAEAAKQNR
ncbi:MAG: hypothetical protein HUU20_13355, partial [Pirellulales bacterium]|nr:hypothetical protein [Pirellulales bacterium]